MQVIKEEKKKRKRNTMSPHGHALVMGQHHVTVLKVQNSAVPEDYKITTAAHQQVELQQHLRRKEEGVKARRKEGGRWKCGVKQGMRGEREERKTGEDRESRGEKEKRGRFSRVSHRVLESVG